jgi:hypothetical protein
MKMKRLCAVAALPLLALAGAASAVEPVILSDVQLDRVTAGIAVAPEPEVVPVEPDVTPVAGLVLFKFDLIAVGSGCCGAASTQVIFSGATAPVATVASELSAVQHVVSQGTYTGVAITTALPTRIFRTLGPPPPN